MTKEVLAEQLDLAEVYLDELGPLNDHDTTAVRRARDQIAHVRAALSSPCAYVDAQEVEDWIAGLSTMDDAVARAAEANALILKLRDRKPCARGGGKPLLSAVYPLAIAYADGTFSGLARIELSGEILQGRKRIRVLILDEPQEGAKE